MAKKVLTNKPLVEAIFEMRWELQEPKKGIKIDPHYKILIGRIYEKLKKKFPYHEQLMAAAIPDEVASYMIQHRFRRGKNQWPLVQLGPGIITINDTDGYTWNSFSKTISDTINDFLELYQNAEDLKIIKVLLRYINSVSFDYENNDVLAFLETKLKNNIKIYSKLFENTEVKKTPAGIDLRFAYDSLKPKGLMSIKFARGKREDSDAFLWETIISIERDEVPQSPKKIETWLVDAHELTEDWFFKLIEGDLEKEFK